MREETIKAIKEVFGKDDKPVIVWEVEESNDESYDKLSKEERNGASTKNTTGI